MSMGSKSNQWARPTVARGYQIVRTRTGSETHWGEPGQSVVSAHQLASARSITSKAYGATEVTCDRCRPIWLASQETK
jgi:hypothetical protein